MAVTGVHFECHYAGPPGTGNSLLPIPRELVWSENPGSGTATAQPVPAQDPSLGRAIVTCVCTVDSWVAEHPSAPAPGANPRRLIPAGSRVDFSPTPGNKLAWVAA